MSNVDRNVTFIIFMISLSLSLCECVLALKPPRKSNCVKEVERLKKNREERRFVVLYTFAHDGFDNDFYYRAKQLAQREVPNLILPYLSLYTVH